MNNFLPRSRSEDGSVLIEATFALSALLLVLFGIMEFSRALYTDIFIGYAAHAATRYAMVRGATWNPTACSASVTANCTATAYDIANYVRSIAPTGVDTSGSLTISPLWLGKSASGGTCLALEGPSSPGCIVQVRVSYTFRFALPVISSTPLLLESSSAVTIAQ